MRRLLLILAIGLASAAHAASPLRYDQNLGADLPLDLSVVDAAGQRRHLGDYFGRVPVILVLGYYRCPRLCSTLMDGVLQGVQDIDLPYTVLALSIDPRETPADAARKLHAYGITHPGARGPHLLTGERPQISRLAQAAGFHYAYDAESGQYSHPAGFLIATPSGRISQYFSGLRFARRDLRLALIEASNNRVGSWAEQIVLLCSHYDPLAGRYTLAVMRLVRAFALLSVLVLLYAVWRLHRRKGARAP